MKKIQRNTAGKPAMNEHGESNLSEFVECQCKYRRDYFSISGNQSRKMKRVWLKVPSLKSYKKPNGNVSSKNEDIEDLA